MRLAIRLLHWLRPVALLLTLPAAAQQQAATPGTGLRGQYFAGPRFEQLVLTRQDAQIDFNWTKDERGNYFVAPGPGVPGEGFSVRWTGWLYAPITGFYLLQTTADDGMRVWVGGRSVINSWRDQAATAATGRVRLEAGRYYPLRVEYYQKERDSRARLAWVPADAATGSQPIPTRYLYAVLPPTARPLPPAPVAARPARASPTGGTIRVVRGAATGPDMAVPLAQGTAVSGPVPAGSGLRASYYAGQPDGAVIHHRIEPTVNATWRGGPPAPGVPPQGFSVRYTGYVRAPETGIYILHAEWDDAHDVNLASADILRMTKYEPEYFGVEKGTPIPVDVTQRYEAGKFYAVDLAYKDVRGRVSRAVFSWLRPDELGQPATYNRARAAAKSRKPGVVPQQYLYPELPPPPPIVAAAPKPTPPPQPVPKPTPKTAVVARRSGPRPATTPVSRPTPPDADRGARPVLTELATLRRGAALTLPNLYFSQSTAELLPASRPVLDELAQTLRRQPALRLQVVGHTDNVGDAARNRLLSQQRARVVRRYLVQQGIDSLRLTAVGYGGAYPVADNRNPELRPRNRRVEVVVVR
ncbi:PA14 domain-containing protein [Hymenobacter aerophilus]|uniref:PA14 domain-containing protein n=1 Tax=Hymenobacter aerophilus TaxID=119644 RepID=UPI0003A664EF|nr:PA14 domain-containing protein [Hymenobacter aerophilus]